LAAGELFAEHGLEGTSVRAIAEKAGANIAAINYHFGSKENLYNEALRYVMLHGKDFLASEYFNEKMVDSSPSALSKILYVYVKQRFISRISKENPLWFFKLVTRSLLEYSIALKSLVEEFFRPDMDALTSFILKAGPEITREKAYILALWIEGQIAFYALCREPVLMILEKERYDDGFINAASDQIARALITVLRLPEPKE
jgi:AcrR family transcriptional regulator